MTPRQQLVFDALSAAWDRHMAPKRSDPAYNTRLRAFTRERLGPHGMVISGAVPETDPQLKAFIDDEMAKRGVVPANSSRLFLDMEWADQEGAELVSLALVSLDGNHELYVERDPLLSEPTAFVRSTVYPLFDRGAAATPLREITLRVREFLTGFAPPVLIEATHRHDFVLLRRTVAGCGLPIAELLGLPLAPMFDCRVQGVLIDSYFATRPEARDHHALHDARAHRAAVIRHYMLAPARLTP
jgi:hypothetical protein